MSRAICPRDRRSTETLLHFIGLTQDRRYAEAIIDALEACAIHGINADTCGVCGKHFRECEQERASHSDEPNANQFFDCPGARARMIFKLIKPQERP